MGAEFVEFDAAPPQTWNAGATALMEAASNGSQRILDDLIARGATIGERDESGSSALHHAANKGEVAAIESLVAAGAALAGRDGRVRPGRPARAGVRVARSNVNGPSGEGRRFFVDGRGGRTGRRPEARGWRVRESEL